MKKIQITIRKDGTQKVEVLGCQGQDCTELTRELERRLGAAEGERTFKPEYYESAAEQETERQEETEGGA
jgi:hypothetical protein